ncbi:hypothetical protein [Mitsuokella sp.]|uniref:hypothetical protein n=1 Tax=Mitsuokella sp. TaxID=2049034 RepID=UPI003D7E3D83
MKKIISVVLLLITLCLASMAQASSMYEDYYNGDTNFPIIYGHMGTAWYLDKSSLVCQDYNPPCYTLAINVIVVPNADRGNRDISQVQTMRFFYNLSDLKMYVDRNTGSSDWRYLKPTGSEAESGLPMDVGEAAFYIDYGKKFYGSRNWYFPSLHKYLSVFPSSFYSKL